MGKKLNAREIEKRTILKIIARIKTIEEDYGIEMTRRACQRYAQVRLEEKNLQEKATRMEKELAELKKHLFVRG